MPNTPTKSMRSSYLFEANGAMFAPAKPGTSWARKREQLVEDFADENMKSTELRELEQVVSEKATPHPFYIPSMDILAEFITFMGISAVAASLVALYFTATTGLFAFAATGIATTLIGLGMWSVQENSSSEMDDKLNTARALT